MVRPCGIVSARANSIIGMASCQMEPLKSSDIRIALLLRAVHWRSCSFDLLGNGHGRERVADGNDPVQYRYSTKGGSAVFRDVVAAPPRKNRLEQEERRREQNEKESEKEETKTKFLCVHVQVPLNMS